MIVPVTNKGKKLITKKRKKLHLSQPFKGKGPYMYLVLMPTGKGKVKSAHEPSDSHSQSL